MAGPADDDLRFADVLTTASAVADYLGERRVTAVHALRALDIRSGAARMEDLGRAVSPLVRRAPAGSGAEVDEPLRELAQRWFADLGSDVGAILSTEQRAILRRELESLGAGEHPG